MDEFASKVKSVNAPVRISLAPEMNSEWAVWGVTNNGNTTESHKQFWRYVINRFRNNGATNVSWIWSPNVRFYGDPCSYSQIYPGNDYVDFVGLDGYNWGTTQSWSTWQSFSEVFGASYNELTGISSKNILIMEVASAEKGGDKAAWITTMFSDMQNKFPRIQGLTWFSINKETDWRINSSDASKLAFSNGANGRASTGAATSSTAPSANSSSDSVNKKGSKSYQVNLKDANASSENKTSTTAQTASPPTTANFNDVNAGPKATFAKLDTKLKKDRFNSTSPLWKIYFLFNLLFLLIVFILNIRLHHKHLRSRFHY